MRSIALLLMLTTLTTPTTRAADIALAIHGGAGALARSKLGADKEAAIRADLERALRAGHAVLKGGGSSLEAVTRAVVVLEDSPHFNAGKGSVFNHDGQVELDASIMDGSTQMAGAVAGVHRVRNPILLARAVMEDSPHVMMVGDGAETFAKSVGIELVDPRYFHTEHRWKELQDALAKERSQPRAALESQAYIGTVGAVALDAQGRLAAATSTGGMTNKRYGRIGDSPIIGAGTYANAQCAVSGTGWGEYFIRATVAHDICARVAYRGDSVQAAADEVVLKVVPAMGGDGGAIAMDSAGRIAMPFNTDGMYRGTIDAAGTVKVAIYHDDDLEDGPG